MLVAKRTAARGFALVDVVAALLLLGLVMGIAVQTVDSVADVYRHAHRRQLALSEAGNLLEHFAAQPWPQITQTAARELQLSDTGRQFLPAAELAVEVAPVAEPPGKRVTIDIRWGPAEQNQHVELTTWVFAPEEEP